MGISRSALIVLAVISLASVPSVFGKKIPGIINPRCRNLMCTMEYDPICGSDGNTYSNSCEMSRHNRCFNIQPPVQVVCKGTCETNCNMS